jgi:hypothetical protein
MGIQAWLSELIGGLGNAQCQERPCQSSSRPGQKGDLHGRKDLVGT